MKSPVIYILIMSLVLITPMHAYSQPASPGEAVENLEFGSINWTVGEVYATAIGAPPARAANPAQARAMAERAAYVVALRNLLETVKGVRIDAETVVEDFMVKSDVIRSQVSGVVKGARIMKTSYLSDGSVEVLVAMPMKGAFLNTILPEKFGSTTIIPAPQPPAPPKPSDIRPAPVQPEPQRPSPAPPEKKAEPVQPAPPSARPEPPASSGSTVVFKGGVATGLVIDARGLGLRPALMPRILDHQGQEIYVGQIVTRTNAVQQGVAGYAKDVTAAANNFRVTDNPVVIKGIRASGAARTDVVLAQADAQALRQLGQKGDFLQYCRVIIVY